MCALMSRLIQTHFFNGSFRFYSLKPASVSHFPMSVLYSVTNRKSFMAHVEKAAECIAQGKVIALPTDTVYGLAAAAQNPQAIQRLYEIKGRDPEKPLAICVDNVDSISYWGKVDNLPRGLLNALLPGPVTVLLERTSNLNPALNPDSHRVGVRIPDSDFVRKLCDKINVPLALTSANVSSEPSTLAPEEFKSLWPHLGAVFHSGKLGDSASSRLGSTVVDLSFPGKCQILRCGCALESTRAILQQYDLVED